MTFHELCDDLGQAEVARRCGESRSNVGRWYHAEVGVSERALQALRAAFRDYDEQGTIQEWFRRRSARAASQATREERA